MRINKKTNNSISIKSLIAQELTIPFKETFGHASATRTKGSSILVCIESEEGICGYGEGCPRPYVTNETLETSLAFFDVVKSKVAKIEHIDQLGIWIGNHTALIDENPAAWCAIECALIDLMAKSSGKTVEALLGLPKIEGDYQYTALLGTGSVEKFNTQLKRYAQVGFSDYKIKLSGALSDDQLRVKAIADQVKRVRIRLDANNLWHHASEATQHIQDLNIGSHGNRLFAIEEPLQARDYEGLENIVEQCDLSIVLDESFCHINDFKYIDDTHTSKWIINLRISKMGGLLRSLATLREARRRNIPIIIGAQVGETSLLTRAALTVATAAGNLLIAQEGAFGTHLLAYDICDPPLMFGSGGRLSAHKLIEPKVLDIDPRTTK